MKINKLVKVITSISMLSMAYAMENQADNDHLDQELPIVVAGKCYMVTENEILQMLADAPGKLAGGSRLHFLGVGQAPKIHVPIDLAANVLALKMTTRLGEIGLENANLARRLDETSRRAAVTEAALRQTSEQLQESAATVANAAAIQRALEEQQERADRLAQELNNLKLKHQALELALDQEQEKTHGLLTAKNTAERDSRLKQKRVETLESLNEEKAKIIEQLQHVEQEKAKLEKSKSLLENLLKRKLNLEGSLDEISPEKLEQLIAEQEEHARTELKRLRSLIEEEKRKEFELQQQIAQLGEEKIRNERRIEELMHTIYLSENPYEYLARLINLPAAEFSDENLACEIMVIVHREKRDLDELTPSDKTRLIELLIDRTRPYQRVYDDYNRRRSDKIIPGGENDRAYKGRDRELGNVFIKGGFGFGGNPLDMKACRYKGSQFEKSVNGFISGIK